MTGVLWLCAWMAAQEGAAGLQEGPETLAPGMVDFDTETVKEVQTRRGPRSFRAGILPGNRRTVREVEVRVPVVGPERRRVDWSEFYEVVGRPDLASEFRRRTLIGTGALVTSIGMFATGAAVLAVGVVLGVGVVAWRGQVVGTRTLSDPLAAAGVVVVFASAAVMAAALTGGAGLMWWREHWEVQPVEPGEIAELAWEHNARVRAGPGH